MALAAVEFVVGCLRCVASVAVESGSGSGSGSGGSGGGGGGGGFPFFFIQYFRTFNGLLVCLFTQAQRDSVKNQHKYDASN